MVNLSFNNKSFHPQALSSGLQSRISKDPNNALIVNTAPLGRSAKRNAQQINYAEFDNFNDDFEYDDVPTSTNMAQAVANNQMNSNAQKILLKSARNTRYPENIDNEAKVDELKSTEENLVPIKLNLEYNNGNSKITDFFMWNLNQSLILPGEFSLLLCNDLELPNYLIQEIAESIERQIEEYNYTLTLQLPSTMEYHVIIDLAVSLDKNLYEDRFEWDLAQTNVTPEQFADVVVGDLGLSLEFKPAISHSLYEIILRLKKEIVEGSYNHELHKYQQLSGLLFERSIRISTESSIHNGNDQWEPVVEVLTPWEIEKREIERERNIRRLKRENMRREVDDISASKRRALGRRRFDELEGTWR